MKLKQIVFPSFVLLLFVWYDSMFLKCNLSKFKKKKKSVLGHLKVIWVSHSVAVSGPIGQ